VQVPPEQTPRRAQGQVPTPEPAPPEREQLPEQERALGQERVLERVP
jgi:hypothetical protein